MFNFLFGQKAAYENLNAADFERSLNEDKTAGILDVRTAAEFREGHIKNAKNLDIMGGEFAAKVESLDKEKTWYVYCRSGGRSASACSAMAKMGFSRVVNLNGGMMAWRGKVVR